MNTHKNIKIGVASNLKKVWSSVGSTSKIIVNRESIRSATYTILKLQLLFPISYLKLTSRNPKNLFTSLLEFIQEGPY